MTDDLPFDYDETPATVNVTTKRCGRHDWYGAYTEDVYEADQGGYVDLPDGRAIAVGLGRSLSVPRELPGTFVCARCGKVRDETVVRRNRCNRQRGASFERSVAKRLGGRRTGPLGGRDDVMVGGMFAAQTKRAQRFSLAEARKYLDDLRRTYPDRTPIVVHAFPSERGGVVVVGLDDWVSLHGSDATREEAS